MKALSLIASFEEQFLCMRTAKTPSLPESRLLKSVYFFISPQLVASFAIGVTDVVVEITGPPES